MGRTIVTSISVLSLPGNRSLPYTISATSSTRFRLAEFIAFTEISESSFVFTVFLIVTLLPSFIFMSLVLSITILVRIVPFRVLDIYTGSLLSSYCVALIGELTSRSSVAKSISNLLNLPSHPSNLSRISRISGLLRPVFNINWVP